MKDLKWYALLLFLSVLIVPLIMYSLFFDRQTPEMPTPQTENDIFDMQISLYITETDEVQTLDCYSYICGVLAAEMPVSFHTEALKAQTVAAFTYMINKSEHPSDHPDAYVCDDFNHCKAYMPVDDARKKYGDDFEVVESAVSSVLGKIITADGQPINAVFHSMSCGITASAFEVWGSDVAYLQSVECASDMSEQAFESEVVLSHNEFSSLLFNELGVTLSSDPSGWIGETTLYPSGYVEKITIGGTEYQGTYIRKLFSLRSAAFDLTVTDENAVFKVRGYGHGVGMSQYGANAMAENGSDYIEILKHFYTDVTITDYKI